MRTILWIAVMAGLCATSLGVEPDVEGFARLENGTIAFDTGLFRGSMRLDGSRQGVASLVHVASGTELAASVGLLSYYRVFSTGTRYGDAARDWPCEIELSEDGSLAVTIPPGDDHPLTIVGTYRWRDADTIDLETRVTPQIDMSDMELFVSSYFDQGFRGAVCLAPNRFAKDDAWRIVPADWSPLFDGNYLMWPRDRESLQMIHDGRWEVPPHPVTWAFTHYLGAPIGVRRNESLGLTVVWMSTPSDCFAVSMPYNKQPPDNVANHGSVYLSLFGRDIAAGETATAHCRMILAEGLDDEGVTARYGEYLNERKAAR